MVTLKQIHKRLVESIKQSGYSQTLIAKQLNVSQQTISHYIKGDKMPALDTLANLCRVIDVSPAYILCFEDESGSKTAYEVFEYSDGKHSVRHKLG